MDTWSDSFVHLQDFVFVLFNVFDCGIDLSWCPVKQLRNFSRLAARFVVIHDIVNRDP
jgi:hypothetical protein